MYKPIYKSKPNNYLIILLHQSDTFIIFIYSRARIISRRQEIEKNMIITGHEIILDDTNLIRL